MDFRTETEPRRRKLVPEMEGFSARQYAKLRGTGPHLARYRRQAELLTGDLVEGGSILEVAPGVAPGPGYLAVEIARLGLFEVTGLDISRTFVGLASELALQAGVRAHFQHGDATAMPFPADEFDLIICQAAFKNFVRPVTALDEMHRVLRPGGNAVIQDMNGHSSNAAIAREVQAMDLGTLAAFITRWTPAGLRRRAYSPAQFEKLARHSTFGAATISTEDISLEVLLTKH